MSVFDGTDRSTANQLLGAVAGPLTPEDIDRAGDEMLKPPRPPCGSRENPHLTPPASKRYPFCVR